MKRAVIPAVSTHILKRSSKFTDMRPSGTHHPHDATLNTFTEISNPTPNRPENVMILQLEKRIIMPSIRRYAQDRLLTPPHLAGYFEAQASSALLLQIDAGKLSADRQL